VLRNILPETTAIVALKVFKKASFETGEEGGYSSSTNVTQDLFQTGRHMQFEPVYRFCTLLLQAFFPGLPGTPVSLSHQRTFDLVKFDLLSLLIK